MKSKRSRIAINRLKTKQTFGSLFPRDEKMVDAIAGHMLTNGYDESQPIIVWDRTEEEGNNNALYIVDGHTRKCAAVEAGISHVYVARVKFADEEAALKYAIHNQRDRRNITDADLIRCIEAVDKRKRQGERTDLKSNLGSLEPRLRSAEQTAETVGTSPTKVKKVRTVLDHADEQTKRDVETGDKTINKAYTETQQKRRARKQTANPQIEELDSMPDYIELKKIHDTFLDKLFKFDEEHRNKKRLRKEYIPIFHNWTDNLNAWTKMCLEHTTASKLRQQK